MFGFFKKKNKKRVKDYGQIARDRRTYLINGEWVHVPNCVDDTPWAEADESVKKIGDSDDPLCIVHH